MEGNLYLHITISKHIIIENSLGVAIYGHTYNIMHTILVGKLYHTILDEGPFYGPFLVQDTCMPPSPLIHIVVYTYIGLFQQHTCIHCFRDVPQSASGTCQTHWLAYLLEEHVMLCCIELYLRSINVIDCPC